MGIITLQLPNETIDVKIAGNNPTVAEQIKINNFIRSRKRQSMAKTADVKAKPEQKFDTTSGIKNTALRAALSTAEINTEQDEVLKKFGMDETDFTRDNRGRLALTPSGASKLGIQIDKDTLIDEEGFSRYDFADLAGIAPELVGAVAGALKGAAVGTGIAPGVGTIIGGAIGAGLGSGTGAAAEEAVEALAGTSKQSAKEIAKDIGKEAAIGFVGDLTFGTAGAIFRGGRKMLTGTDKITPEELATIRKAKELGIEPSIGTLRGPAVIARQQAIIEKIFGTSPRLKKNYDVMMENVNRFRNEVGQSGIDEADVGRVLIEGTGKQVERLKTLKEAAEQAVIKQLDDIGQTMGAAAEKNTELTSTLFEYLTKSSENFNKNMSKKFNDVDNIITEIVGKKQFIPAGNILSTIQNFETEYITRLAAGGRDIEPFQDVINGLKAGFTQGTRKLVEDTSAALRNPDSFLLPGPLKEEVFLNYRQLYEMRKAAKDGSISVLKGGREFSNTANRELKKLTDEIDSLLNGDKFVELVELSPDLRNVVTSADKIKLKKAFGELQSARNQFAAGTRAFDQVENANIIKNIAGKVRDGVDLNPNDLRIDKILTPGNKAPLKKLLAALGEGSTTQKNRMQETLKREWLRDTLSKNGIKPDDYKVGDFKGHMFRKDVEKMGETLDELYGKAGADRIRSLAKQIDQTSVDGLKTENISAFLQGEGQSLTPIQQLNNVLNEQKRFLGASRKSAFAKLADDTLTDTEAAAFIASRNVKATDIRQIMKAFKGNDDALQKIRSNYMDRIIADFGDAVTTDGKTLKAFAERIISENDGGKLVEVFGKELGNDMFEFAKVLKLISRTTNGGDLVAANIAASPIQNAGKIIKYGILSRFMTSAPYMKSILKRAERETAGLPPSRKAAVFGQILADTLSQVPGQLVDEGVSEGIRQGQALMQNTEAGQQLSQAAGQLQQLRQNITPPNISSGLGQINPVAPVTPQQTNIRQKAKQNPAVAQTLGIQGATQGLI